MSISDVVINWQVWSQFKGLVHGCPQEAPTDQHFNHPTSVLLLAGIYGTILTWGGLHGLREERAFPQVQRDTSSLTQKECLC